MQINNEMTWRKMPRTVFTDPNFDYIASCLPQQYAAAPYMFYLVALSAADDDGIFDLEDGVIFSRLMHIDSIEVVFKIANLMMKRKIITRNGNTSICMLTNWEYSIKEKNPRTLADRRQIVQRQIEAANAMKSKEFSISNDERNGAEDVEFSVDFNSTPSSDEDFLCTLNDKNTKNVANDFYGDKTAENVTKKNETEKIREDKNREIEHTQNRLDIEKPLQANSEAFRGTEQTKEVQDYEEKWDGTETQSSEDVQDLAEIALSEGTATINDERQTRLFSTFVTFFAKNCIGFSESASRSAIIELCRRMFELSSDKNPPGIVASTVLSQFKKLTEDEGYFHGMPLTPEKLLIPNTYQYVLAAASRILLSSNNITPAWIRQLEEAKAEKEQVGDGITDEYIKYGIDPQDPNKAALLLRAKSAAAKGETGP